MQETKQKSTTKGQTSKSAIVELARDIARKSNEPMSIDEIRAKFDPAFPFQVKKVVKPAGTLLEVGAVVEIVGYHPTVEGSYNCAFLAFDWAAPGNYQQWVLV